MKIIEPRKTTDTSGLLLMPLCKHIPEGKPGWKKIKCPICGELCWSRPGDKNAIADCNLYGAVCTFCGISRRKNERKV